MCPIEHLLARMAIDTQCIAKRITNLLSQSFFPVNESESEWCHRCITLIQMNPMAARIFYLHIHQFVTPTNIGKRTPKPLCVGSVQRPHVQAFSLLVLPFQSS